MDGLEVLTVGILAFLMILSFIGTIIYIIIAIGMWKILEKGNKPGWGALIPIYNVYLICDMVGVNPWWILITILSPVLMVIPIIGELAVMAIYIYFLILLNVSLSRAFKKEDTFAIGLILLAPVFYIILGFGKENKFEGKNPMKDIVFETINENLNKKDSDVKEAEYEEKK